MVLDRGKVGNFLSFGGFERLPRNLWQTGIKSLKGHVQRVGDVKQLVSG